MSTGKSSVKILEQLAITAEMTGTSFSEPTARALSAHLSAFEEKVVLGALVRCQRELKGRLTLADILERIEESDGRLNANEAWGIAIKAKDESASLVWTDEIAEAFGACRPIMLEGDEVGARMAFKDAYERITRTNREQGKKQHWLPSLGHDPAGRECVIREAIEMGRLPAPAIGLLLPPAGMEIPAKLREEIKQLRTSLDMEPAKRIAERAEAERQYLAVRKERVAKQAAQLLNQPTGTNP